MYNVAFQMNISFTKCIVIHNENVVLALFRSLFMNQGDMCMRQRMYVCVCVLLNEHILSGAPITFVSQSIFVWI